MGESTIDWASLVLVSMRREALRGASRRAQEEAERCSRLLSEGKLSPLAKEHIQTLEKVHLGVAEALMREAAQ